MKEKAKLDSMISSQENEPEMAQDWLPERHQFVYSEGEGGNDVPICCSASSPLKYSRAILSRFSPPVSAASLTRSSSSDSPPRVSRVRSMSSTATSLSESDARSSSRFARRWGGGLAWLAGVRREEAGCLRLEEDGLAKKLSPAILRE